MPDAPNEVKPGDPLAIPAATWNLMIDAVRAPTPNRRGLALAWPVAEGIMSV